jgi:23S rRNA pseudouridine1911/1915/1917 synthase
MSTTQHSAFNIGDWVVFKCNQFIVFNKPAGIPVQADKTGDNSLLQLGSAYSKRTLFPINRIDRPASGLVVFGRKESATAHLSEQFRERKVEKTYLAVVGEMPSEKSGTLRHFIRKSGKGNKAIIVDEQQGKEAVLEYKVLGSIENYHLLEIKPLTGRYHQIRAQLAAIGCPIKGDVKYGFRRSNKDRSIHLHAWKLALRHPVSGELLNLEAPTPEDPVWKAFADNGSLPPLTQADAQ